MFAVTTLQTFGLGLLGASVPAITSAWFIRRKTKAETADLITQASGRVVEMMQDRISELQSEIKVLRDRQVADQSERAALHMRLVEAEKRERAAVVRIGELQVEVDALRQRVARYETPIIQGDTPS